MFTRTGAFCFNSFTLFTLSSCSTQRPDAVVVNPRSPRDLLTASSARIPNWISSHSFIYSSGRLISKPCGRHQEAPSILRFHIALHYFSSLLVNLILTCFLSVLERLAFLDEFGQGLYACLGAEECCCEPVIWGTSLNPPDS